jgi:NADH-quinone oxidoreductase subunit N
MPIIAISFFAVFSIVFDAVFKNKNFSFYFALFGFVVVIIAAAQNLATPVSKDLQIMQPAELITHNMITFGGFAAYMDMLFALGGLLTLFASRQYIKREYKELNEFYSLLIISVSGMMLIAHANNLLIVFIGIEIMSISFYVLAGYFRTSLKSVEAALKYFLLGAFATGFLIYGMALIYGSTGSLDLSLISSKLFAGQFDNTYLLIGIGLMLVGLSFKVAAFPFHQWAPDVYHGAPTVISGFMSSAGKAAALVAFIVILKAVLSNEASNELLIKNSETIRNIIAYIAAATMLIGNLTALVQKNIKRMLAYSSVAHAGYLLMGIVANTALGWTGIIFYVTAYLFMQLGAFVVLSILERDDQSNLQISDYNGLHKSHPVLAAMMAVFMLSLAGIPPFAGFFGKYYLFIAAINSGYLWLTIVAVVATIISMYYYINVILAMYFRDNDGAELDGECGTARITLFITVACLIIFGVFPFLITDLTKTFFQ